MTFGLGSYGDGTNDRAEKTTGYGVFAGAEMSVSMWFRRNRPIDGSTPQEIFFLHGASWSTGQGSLRIYHGDAGDVAHKLNWYHYYESGGDTQINLVSAVPVLDHDWHHVAVTLSYADNGVHCKMWLDKVDVTDLLTFSSRPSVRWQDAWWAWASFNGANKFRGDIAEQWISVGQGYRFDAASDVDPFAMPGGGPNGFCPQDLGADGSGPLGGTPPTAYYQGPNNQIAVDLSGNGRSLTVIGDFEPSTVNPIDGCGEATGEADGELAAFEGEAVGGAEVGVGDGDLAGLEGAAIAGAEVGIGEGELAGFEGEALGLIAGNAADGELAGFEGLALGAAELGAAEGELAGFEGLALGGAEVGAGEGELAGFEGAARDFSIEVANVLFALGVYSVDLPVDGLFSTDFELEARVGGGAS